MTTIKDMARTIMPIPDETLSLLIDLHGKWEYIIDPDEDDGDSGMDTAITAALLELQERRAQEGA